MPSLIALGRHWNLGSDDFVFPGLADLFLRLSWIIVIAILFGFHGLSTDVCKERDLIKIYYTGILIILSCHVIVDSFLIFLSARGTIMYSYPRRHLPKLLYLKLFLVLPDIGWNVIGTYWAFHPDGSCQWYIKWAIRGAVIVGWAVQLVLLIIVFVLFDKKQDPELQTLKAKKRWLHRFRLFCCCVRCDEHSEHALEEAASVLTHVFAIHGFDRLVVTDVATGLILVSRKQATKLGREFVHSIARQQEPLIRQGENQDIEDRTASQLGAGDFTEGFPTPKQWMTLPNAKRYMTFALGVYGWPLYVYTNVFTGGCRLINECRCCSCCPSGDTALDDNCCGCNTAALCKITGLRKTDLIYVSFINKIYLSPFYLAFDHEHRNIILSIRGSMSLRDLLTDMTADLQDFEHHGDNHKVHKGVYRAAINILDILREKQILETALSQHPDYNIMLVGHSLGAGIAALLALILETDYGHKVACFAFSPPGWTISSSLLEPSNACVCSVVIGSDLIPRFGLTTVEMLKVEVLQSIQDCQMPKYKVLTKGFWQAFCTCCCIDPVNSASLEEQALVYGHVPLYTPLPNHLHEDQYRLMDSQFKEHMSNAIEHSLEEIQSATKLYMPGQVLYLKRTKKASCCGGDAQFQPVWARPHQFDEIVVGADMIGDHLPDVVMDILSKCTEQGLYPTENLVKQPFDR